MRRRPDASGGDVNMTPMIDVVFQMIIFFVTTVEMERQSLLETIDLATAPHGPAVEKINPLTVKVDVDEKGRIFLSRSMFSFNDFVGIMQKTVSIHGNQVPVVIRGDQMTRHEDIRKVMDACKKAGLWRVKFSAVKDEA